MKTNNFRLTFLVLATLSSTMQNALAGEVVQVTAYLNNEECAGSPTSITWLGVPGQCQQVAPDLSVEYTCSETLSYSSSGECTGDSVDTDFPTLCESPSTGTSRTIRCETFPDNRIGKLLIGETCSVEDDVVPPVDLVISEMVFVTDVCQKDNDRSYKYTVGEDSVTLTLYTESTTCTGVTESITLEIGVCDVSTDLPGAGGASYALKFIPAIEGSTLDDTTTETPTASPAANDDDGNTPGSAMAGSSTSIFALVMAMVGALAMMF